MNSKNLYLENKKSKILLFTISFLFLFFLSQNVISTSSGEWNSDNSIGNKLFESNSPGWNMLTNSHEEINLNGYCFNCSFYWLTFRNPDNLVQVVSMKSINNNISSNSFFKIQLTSQGILKIDSKSVVGTNDNDVALSIYSSDNGNFPKSFQLVFLRIRENLKPQYIGGLPSSIGLEGNDSFSAEMPFSTDIPSMATKYTFQVYQGSTKTNEVYTDNTTYPNGRCVSFWVKTCISGIGKDGLSTVMWTISGINESASGSIFLIAENQYGSTKSPAIQLNTIKRNQSTINPFRTNTYLTNIELGFNESGAEDFFANWKNFTYIVANFTYPTNSTQVTLNSSEKLDVDSRFIENGYFYIEVTPTAFLIRSGQQNITFPVSITACNSNGCNSNDNQFSVTIEGLVPLVNEDYNKNTLVLAYHEYKGLILSNIFSRLKFASTDYYRLDWNDGINGPVQMFISSYAPISNQNFLISNVGQPYYQVIIEPQNSIYFLSGETNINFDINTSACNSQGCSTGPVIHFYIQGGQEPEIVSQIGNNPSGNFFTNSVSSFMGFFPNKDNISSSQKTAIVLIAMFIVSLGILLLLNESEISAGSKLVSITVVNSGLFLFFLIKGYINFVIPVVIALAAIFIIVMKIRSP